MKSPMTQTGHTQLTLELERLKFTERPKIIQAIQEARAHGDLKENAEYHAAREQQAFNEGRISELEHKLSNAQVIDISKIPPNGKVLFGATVLIMNLETEEEMRYQIVSEEEANLKQGKISLSSPIARALIGKETGEVVVVKTPSGEVEYEILDSLHL